MRGLFTLVHGQSCTTFVRQLNVQVFRWRTLWFLRWPLTRSILNEGKRVWCDRYWSRWWSNNSCRDAWTRVAIHQYLPRRWRLHCKDISKVLTTSQKHLPKTWSSTMALLILNKRLKKEKFTVEDWRGNPVEVTERYLSEVIAAPSSSNFQSCQTRFGTDSCPWVARWNCPRWWWRHFTRYYKLAQRNLGRQHKLYIPNQIGIHNPSFAHVIALVEYVGGLDDVEKKSPNWQSTEKQIFVKNQLKSFCSSQNDQVLHQTFQNQ